MRIFAYPNSAEEEGLQHLAGLEQLRELWLYGISDKGMPHIGELKSLARLSIDGGSRTTSSRYLDALPQLEYLDARGTQIAGARLREFDRIFARPGCNRVRRGIKTTYRVLARRFT